MFDNFVRRMKRAVPYLRRVIAACFLSVAMCMFFACQNRPQVSYETIPASDNINGHPHLFLPASKMEHDPDCPQCEKRMKDMVREAVREAIMEMKAKSLEDKVFKSPRDSSDTIITLFP